MIKVWLFIKAVFRAAWENPWMVVALLSFISGLFAVIEANAYENLHPEKLEAINLIRIKAGIHALVGIGATINSELTNRKEKPNIHLHIDPPVKGMTGQIDG